MLHHSLPHHDQRAYTVVGWVWLLRLDVWAPYKLVCGGDRALDQALQRGVRGESLGHSLRN